MIIVPTGASTAAAFNEDVQIEDEVFGFTFLWNEREAHWYMDLITSGDEPILTGVKLVADWDIIGRYTDERLPTGLFFALDLSGAGVDPGRNDLSDRVVLTYFTEAEIAAL